MGVLCIYWTKNAVLSATVDEVFFLFAGSKPTMPAYGEKKSKTTRKSKAKDVFEFDGDSDTGKAEVLINEQGKP